MNNKKDILYCGVRKEKIKSAHPILMEKIVKQWFFHQKERTSIYYKKEILGQKAPWTQDEILQKYKFVNTKRIWDRETRWLLKSTIDNAELSYEDKLLNCFLFRVINKWETLDLLWWAINFNNLSSRSTKEQRAEALRWQNIENFRKILDNKAEKDPEYVFFSAAYILWWPKVNFWKYLEKKEWKIEKNMILRMIKFVLYNREKIISWIWKAKNQQEVYEHLKSFSWIGKFLAYQIFIDMTYLLDFPFTENNFVISWPWCERWIDWIFEERDGMTSEECLFWFVENQYKIAKKDHISWDVDKVFHFLPESQRYYSLMDMENSGACEIDKRCRTLFAGKRPKQKYKY